MPKLARTHQKKYVAKLGRVDFTGDVFGIVLLANQLAKGVRWGSGSAACR